MKSNTEKIYGVGILDDNVFEGRKTIVGRIKNFLNLSSPQDHRQAPRVNLSVPVSYQINGEKALKKSAKTIDHSATGIRVSFTSQVKVGNKLDLEIKLPNMQENFKIRGVVVWSKPSKNQKGIWDCGVAFENLRQAPKKEKIISIIADTHARISLNLAKDYTMRPVINYEELQNAYWAVYKEYIKRDYCSPNRWQLHYNFYSLLPTTCTFQLYEREIFLGTISIIGDSPCGLPMESTFSEEIQQLRREGRRLCEVGFLALDTKQYPEGIFSLTNFKKQASLFRLSKMVKDYARFALNATDMIIGVHPKHDTLYRYMHFEPLGPVRSYKGAEGNPALLMRLDFEKAVRDKNSPDFVPGAYFYKDNQPPLEVLVKKFEWNIAYLVDFLVEKKPLWDGLTALQQDHLEHCYPGLKAAVKERQAVIAALPPEKTVLASLKHLRKKITRKVFFTNEIARIVRRAVYAPIFYRSENSNIGWQQSRTLNITERGANIETFHRFFPGDDIEFEMAHQYNGGQEILKIKAEVIWITESENKPGLYKCGVAFNSKEVRLRRKENYFYSLADFHCRSMDKFSKKSQIHPAHNDNDLEAAYRLLYQEYSPRNLCKTNDAEIFYSFYNLLPGSRTFLLRKRSSILGTVGCYPDSPCGLPMEVTYPNEIKELRAEGRKLIEVGSLALNSNYFDNGKWSLKNIEKQAHLFKLFKTIINYTRLYSGATDMIIGCHPKHQTLYEYIFFERIDKEVRDHNGTVASKAILMKMDFELFVRNTVLLHSKSGEYILDKVDTEMLKSHFPWTSQVVDKFLYKVRPLWDKLSESQKDYLKSCYY